MTHGWSYTIHKSFHLDPGWEISLVSTILSTVSVSKPGFTTSLTTPLGLPPSLSQFIGLVDKGVFRVLASRNIYILRATPVITSDISFCHSVCTVFQVTLWCVHMFWVLQDIQIEFPSVITFGSFGCRCFICNYLKWCWPCATVTSEGNHVTHRIFFKFPNSTTLQYPWVFLSNINFF